MNDKLFPVSFTKPLQILTYNEKQEWWEGDSYFGKFACWLEVDPEHYIYYCNFFKVKENDVLEPLPDVVQGFLISPTGEASLIQSTADRYSIRQPVDLMPLKSRDDGLYCSVVFWFLFQKGPAFVIPERPSLLRYEPCAQISEEQLSENKLMIETWRAEREQKRRKAQEQKEQAEKEWEEWEKRQEEDGEK